MPVTRPQSEKLQIIREQRGTLYGGATDNMRDLGYAFTAILESHYGITLPHPIPREVASLLLIALKLLRIAHTPDHEDSHLDLENYIDIFYECRNKSLEQSEMDISKEEEEQFLNI